MKYLFTFISAALIAGAVCAQNWPVLYSKNISKSSLSLEVANPVVVEQIDFEATTSGVALVTFEGYCNSSVGDYITLASSNSTSYALNDGNTLVGASGSDANHTCFSHSMLYTVNAGSNSFYALALNKQKTDGDGVATINATFSVKFYPTIAEYALAVRQPISKTNIDIEDEDHIKIDSVIINAPFAGHAIVTFSGKLVGAVGERVSLAAADINTKKIDFQEENQISLRVFSEDAKYLSFSHTKTYQVAKGENKFYAYAWVNGTDETLASIYGGLVAEFIPSETGQPYAANCVVAKTNIDVTETQEFGRVTIDAPMSGKVYVKFDGYGYASVGDCLEFAASNAIDWSPNDGTVAIEAFSSEITYAPFCHSRVYDVEAGINTFYGVCQNYVELDGDGKTSAYGNLTAVYFPDSVATATSNVKQVQNMNNMVYPNPASTVINIDLAQLSGKINSVVIRDITGKECMTINMVNETKSNISIDVAGYPNGIYYLQIYTDEGKVGSTFIKN